MGEEFTFSSTRLTKGMTKDFWSTQKIPNLTRSTILKLDHEFQKLKMRGKLKESFMDNDNLIGVIGEYISTVIYTKPSSSAPYVRVLMDPYQTSVVESSPKIHFLSVSHSCRFGAASRTQC